MVVNILYFIVQLGDIIVNFDLVVVQLGNTIVNFGIDGVLKVIMFVLNLL